LAKKDVIIRFADSLHMKVYWAEDRGAVVTSANLSTNALGAGSLKEFGVKLGRGQIDIRRVIESVKSRPMTAAELRRLDRQHALLMANYGGRAERKSNDSFRTWLASTAPQEWKLLLCTEVVGLSKTAESLVKSQYAHSSAYDWVTCSDRYLRKSDWLLTFRFNSNQISQVGWMFVDHVIRMRRQDEGYSKECPCEAFQVWPHGRYTSPPFRVDRRLSDGFKKAAREFGVERLEVMKSGKPPKRLIELMKKYC
jgi:hypothetical protein